MSSALDSVTENLQEDIISHSQRNHFQPNKTQQSILSLWTKARSRQRRSRGKYEKTQQTELEEDEDENEQTFNSNLINCYSRLHVYVQCNLFITLEA